MQSCDNSAESEIKTGALTAHRATLLTVRALRLTLGGGVETLTRTLAAGVLTWDRSMSPVIVNGEGAAADDLVTINGGQDGDLLVLRRGDAAITVKHGTGNVYLPGAVDFALDHARDRLILENVGGSPTSNGEWVCWSASSNG